MRMKFLVTVSLLLVIEIGLLQVSSAKITCQPLKLKNGRTRYRQKSGFVQFLCDKGYLLAGDRYMKCVNGMWENEMPTCVRSTCKKVNEPLNGYVYPTHRGGVLNFYCKPGYELQGVSVAYCNGTSWSTYLPTCIDVNKNVSLSCDFEHEDLCGWSHDINHNFDWIRYNHHTPSHSIATGPAHDHTSGEGGDGYYMYVEASGRNPNDTARLISPVFRPENARRTCLEFYYHMYGATTGELRVYLIKPDTQKDYWRFSVEDALFVRRGNHGNRWLRAFLDLGYIWENFQIVMEGVRGGNYMSDTAIDDVRIVENCTDSQLLDETSTDTSTTEVGDATVYELYSCYNRCGETRFVFESGCSCSRCDIYYCCNDYMAYCYFDDSTETTTETDWTTSTTEEETEAETTATASTTESDEFETGETTPDDVAATKWDDESIPAEVTATVKLVTVPTTILRTTRKPNFTTRRRVTVATTRKLTNKTASKSKMTQKTISRISTSFSPQQHKQNEEEPAKESPINQDIVEMIPRTTQTEENFYYRYMKEQEEAQQATSKVMDAKVLTIKDNSKSKEAKWLLLVIYVASGALLLSTVCIIFVYRKRIVNYYTDRRRRSNRAMSESDVRFLTSDEILDFSLAY